MASREEILADFQACTGIEDVEVAICQLEEANWSLVDAVNRAMPSNSPPPPPLPALRPADVVEVEEEVQEVGIRVAGTPPRQVSTLQSSQRPPGPGGGVEVSTGGDDVARRRVSDGAPQPLSSDSFIHSQFLNSASSSFSSNNPFGPGVSIADDFLASGPSGSFGVPRTRMLEFSIQYEDRIIPLKVPDNEDVKTLKQLLQAETGCPPCQQELRGFMSSGSQLYYVNDSRRLSELNLPKENVLQLTTTRDFLAVSSNEEPSPPSEEEVDFKLHISINREQGGTSFVVKYPPNKKVLDVKMDVYTFCSVPVSKQKWEGWPETAKDDQTLAQSGIPKVHNLTLWIKNREPDMPLLGNEAEGPASSSSAAGASASTSSLSGSKPSTANRGQSKKGSDHLESDDEEVEIDDDDEDNEDDDDMQIDDSEFSMGGSETGTSRGGRLRPLIPDDYGDEAMAAIKFSEEFAARYGEPHPNFFPGTLDDALKESCMQPAKDRKMLAVYLHHDNSVLGNVFCAQALCAGSVVSFLSENFVCFGWDLTHTSNRSRAVNMITQHFGSVVASSIRNLPVERLPVLALIQRIRGVMDIAQMVHGSATLDELMSRLLSAHETYQAQLVLEVREEQEREARDAVKREQDIEFERTLKADQEREAQKKREEIERVEQEKLEAAIRQSEEDERQRKNIEMEKIRKHLLNTLPPEPKDEKSEGEPVSQLRFRIPALPEKGEVERKGNCGNKGMLERRFLASNKLQVVLDFLASQGFPSEEFKVLSSWPRRDLTQLNPAESLLNLKLYPQETLTLEER